MILIFGLKLNQPIDKNALKRLQEAKAKKKLIKQQELEKHTNLCKQLRFWKWWAKISEPKIESDLEKQYRMSEWKDALNKIYNIECELEEME